MPSKEEKARRKQLTATWGRQEHEKQLARLPVDRAQLEALLDHVAERLEESGCDHSPRFTEEWAEQNGVDEDQLLDGLLQFGGGCDCEMLMNVEPEELFAPPRQPGQPGR